MSKERRDPVPAYTNEDLERVRPFRDQTGVASKPDLDAAGNERAGTPRQKLGGDGVAARRGRHSAESDEEKWRYQAERLRAKLQPLRDKAADLREQIEERRRQPGVRPYTDPKIVADQRRLAVLEQRIRDSESAFEDRARRQGALPGWIR
jgi:predicted RNase H-like nuclease (RuvC/YqgF family)